MTVMFVATVIADLWIHKRRIVDHEVFYARKSVDGIADLQRTTVFSICTPPAREFYLQHIQFNWFLSRVSTMTRDIDIAIILSVSEMLHNVVIAQRQFC